MAAREINIDDFVDYASEYKAAIKDAKITGDQLIGRCPFHDDNKDSFSADIKTGKCHCFAGCIDGNFISFYAKLNDTDTKTAYKDILGKYGKLEEAKKSKKPKFEELTVKEYALSKGFGKDNEDFLRNTCRILDGKDRDGTRYVKMPYYNEDGKAEVFRKRYGNKEFRWSQGSSGKLILYGAWRLPEIRNGAKWLILVEGESDTQSLWYMQIPALGVPGASNFKAPMVEALNGLDVYIHVEPDQGGKTFFEKVCRILKDNNFTGRLFSWSCQQFGVKDPSELFMKEGKAEAYSKITRAKDDAKLINFDNLAELIPEAVKGAPVHLRQPDGWMFTDHGISHIDEKTAIPRVVCRTPILLTKRLRSLETGEEKIEVAFKRDDVWHKAIFPRSTVFTSRSIIQLADLGATVTSENAKYVIKFLEALEAENIDIIDKAESASTFGWHTRGRFMPGHADDITLDVEPSLRSWATAYHSNGTLEEWVAMIRPHRERLRFRFILASAFAAPLLRILSQRIFLIYNWCNSRGGKTAALKAALSVWGDPERLMANFNATQVALERMAGFYNDLPIGIDERQLAGNKQETLEKIVYMLASGTGRARGSKAGGLQMLSTWRTVAIMTGEEPLTTETSQTGISTRILELYGEPFDNEMDASRMHQATMQHYGHAGNEFIDRLIETDEKNLLEIYGKITDTIYKLANGASGSHIAGIAAVALADLMIDTWIFNDGERTDKLAYSDESWNKAIEMAKMVIDEQASNVSDVNENAAQYVNEWILSNQSQFNERAITCYGTIDDEKAYIFTSILNQVLRKAGYSPRKTIKYLAEQGIIATTTESNGKKVYSVVKKYAGQPSRFVEFDLAKYNQLFESCKTAPSASDDGFYEVSKDEQCELPFK